MISTSEPWPTNEWRRHVAEALSTVDELLEELEIDATALDIVPTSPAVRRFPLRVPRGFVARMRAGDAHDPLLRQVLPVGDEDSPSPGFSADPVGELTASPDTGLLRKYHSREIDDDVERGFAVLRSAGVTLLNQAVLLWGVNDTEDAQCELANRLFAAGVLPYYLHTLDRVEGAAHFEVPDGEALHLMHEVRAVLPGYLVPRLVREVEGEAYKVPL
jgi:L-lysine 2,3-aminomutase